MTTEVHYLRGDATNPMAEGNKIIAHVCDDVGKWGKGFVLALFRHWPQPERAYSDWYRSKDGFALGEIQLVEVRDHLWVANMIGQHGIKRGSNGPPIRYPAVESCLEKVAAEALRLEASVHMPRIGCGLAGGTWDKIEPIILQTLAEQDVEVYVYDLGS
ncbi:MAG: macro domain-containing protein [Micrococcales bacterium]|nr:macro domain-containing protein [Micrococcales bacterium]